MFYSSATSIADFSNANALVPQQQCPADSEHAGLASTTTPQGNGNAEHGYRFDGYSNPSTSSGGTNSTYELRDVSSPQVSQEDEIEKLVRTVDDFNLRYNRSGQGHAIFSGNLHSGGGNQIVGSKVASDGEWGDVTGNHVYYMNNVTPSARGHQIVGQQVIDGAGVPYQGHFRKNENLGPGDQIVGGEEQAASEQPHGRKHMGVAGAFWDEVGN
ncbi:hypothetical protein NPX13_g10663 [Xylaria arbuscula]|uniref:Uncharacterized protein n=1 Tax=Xylaria arbuscula TaxID=114810 RepID=A0A9W8N452_9PEZI|nr:hypothetical protein NPX13_g10663 [Xylaria arbuscula]